MISRKLGISGLGAGDDGRAIIGECDSKVLADMPRSRMRTKLSQLEEASTGHAIDADIAAVDA